MAHLLQAYIDTIFQYTTKLTPDVPQNVHFKTRCCIDKTHKLASNRVFYRCDYCADPDCTIVNLCQANIRISDVIYLKDKLYLILLISGNFHLLSFSVQYHINFPIREFS